jgi:hypothetical protein
MDISNFTYKELETLEKEITKRKEELKKAEYEGLVNGAINAMMAVADAGFEDTVCFYDSELSSWSWSDLIIGIQTEYARKKREDY